MAGYTKGDFIGGYKRAPIDPRTGIRFTGARHPDFPDEIISFYLHYHPAVWKELKLSQAAQMKEKGYIMNGDKIIVLGCGFNWLGEGLEKLGMIVKTCGMDKSYYVNNVKNDPPNDDLVDSIKAAGYEVDDGYVGEYLWNLYKTDEPRAKTPIVLGDIRDDEPYHEVVSLIGTPNKVILDEIWQVTPEAEKESYRVRFEELNLTPLYVIDGIVSD